MLLPPQCKQSLSVHVATTHKIEGHTSLLQALTLRKLWPTASHISTAEAQFDLLPWSVTIASMHHSHDKCLAAAIDLSQQPMMMHSSS